MGRDPHGEHVAAELRSLVTRRLNAGDRPSRIARQLVTLGMRRRDARRFIEYVRRRTVVHADAARGATPLRAAATAAGFGIAGVLGAIAGGAGFRLLVDSMGTLPGLGDLSDRGTTLVESIVGVAVGALLAAIAYGMRSVTGSVAAVLGALLGVYLLISGHVR